MNVGAEMQDSGSRRGRSSATLNKARSDTLPTVPMKRHTAASQQAADSETNE